MATYINGNSEILTKEEAFSCPECGKKADDWNESNWQYCEGEAYKDVTCICNDCNEQWDFQEYKNNNVQIVYG